MTGMHRIAAGIALWGLAAGALGQSVCLPAPRLLTTMPMGGKAGTSVEITIAGEYLDDPGDLIFSDPRLTAIPKRNSSGQTEANKYVVKIAADCPPGIHEARVMTRLGLSSSRIFSVGALPELTKTVANHSVATAMEIPVNSICNAVMSVRNVDHYVFTGRKGQRIIVDAATRGIDSKLDAVVIIADAAGRDLLVERRGGVLDFAVPSDGRYIIKLHELTFKGGRDNFYRLGVWEQPTGTPIVRQAGSRRVNSFSWPPVGLAAQPASAEVEPNNVLAKAQAISLPCDIAGSFFPAADVDLYAFDAKKGEQWWIEVASERLGLPTDPAVLVRHVESGSNELALTDVAEFSDIPSPVRVSSNGYAYDGPPYNPGTADVLGQLEIKADGRHLLQLTDLFGGTRSDPRHRYRLVIRKAAPDFALVAWALHMELRNGDRAALSKPITLRRGATMALEVVAFRRDGFAGPIDLTLEGLPTGVSSRGLRIPAGQARGVMLVTATSDAPRGFTNARFMGHADINGAKVTRPCHLATMSWPIPDAWGEFPSPRLAADVPVSVSSEESAPITIAPATPVVRANVGSKVTIPLVHIRRGEFSGSVMRFLPMGAGFERIPAFDVPLTADKSQVVIDLAALKTPPGDHVLAFHGGAVAKYRYRPEAVSAAEAARIQAKKLADEALAASKAAPKGDAAAKMKTANAALAAAESQLKSAAAAAQPKDIVDIVVSEPITIHVMPEAK